MPRYATWWSATLFQLRVSSSKNSDDTTIPGMTLPGIVSYHEYSAFLDWQKINLQFSHPENFWSYSSVWNVWCEWKNRPSQNGLQIVGGCMTRQCSAAISSYFGLLCKGFISVFFFFSSPNQRSIFYLLFKWYTLDVVWLFLFFFFSPQSCPSCWTMF